MIRHLHLNKIPQEMSACLIILNFLTVKSTIYEYIIKLSPEVAENFHLSAVVLAVDRAGVSDTAVAIIGLISDGNKEKV